MGQYTVGTIPYVCGNENANEVLPSIHVASTWEISAIPSATAGVISTDITMVAAASPLPAGAFHNWELAKAPGKNSYKVEPQGDVDSSLKLHTYVAVMNKVTAARLEATQGGCNHVLIFPDNNGQYWLMGDKENGCAMVRGAEIGATNQIVCTFTWATGKNILQYTGVIPD
jgi:hypothetical protein